MNDSKYINNLIVFQSFLLHYEDNKKEIVEESECLYIPKNFLKHFNFLGSKYPTIFSNASLKKIQIFSENTSLQNKPNFKINSNIQTSPNLKLNENAMKINLNYKDENNNDKSDKDFKDRPFDYKNDAFDLNYNEIHEIVNYLTNLSKKSKIIDIYMKIFDLIEYIKFIKYLELFSIFQTISELLEKIFLKFRLENKKNLITQEIEEISYYIFSIFKFYLFNDLEILQQQNSKLSKQRNPNISKNLITAEANVSNFKSEEISHKQEITFKGFDFQSAFSELIKNNKTEKLTNLKKYFYENYFERLNITLCSFNILLPKSNSIFKFNHTNEVLPFFLEIKLKISNIEYSDKIPLEIIKNLNISLINLNDDNDVIKKKKLISLSFSNTKILKNEFESSISVKIKCAIYLQKSFSFLKQNEKLFSSLGNNYNKNNLNFEICLSLKKRFFDENFQEIKTKLISDQNSLVNFHLEEDLYLTDRVHFSIHK